MTFITARTFADKLAVILSDSRVLQSEWFDAIPMLMIQTHPSIARNARQLAWGILQAVEKYHPNLDQNNFLDHHLQGESNGNVPD